MKCGIVERMHANAGINTFQSQTGHANRRVNIIDATMKYQSHRNAYKFVYIAAIVDLLHLQ